MDFKTAGIIVMLTIPFFVATVWAVINAALREFDSLGHKALWMLVAAIPFVGFIIYFLIGARQGRRPEA